jgi:hypothetical protein
MPQHLEQIVSRVTLMSGRVMSSGYIMLVSTKRVSRSLASETEKRSATAGRYQTGSMAA